MEAVELSQITTKDAFAKRYKITPQTMLFFLFLGALPAKCVENESKWDKHRQEKHKQRVVFTSPQKSDKCKKTSKDPRGNQLSFCNVV